MIRVALAFESNNVKRMSISMCVHDTLIHFTLRLFQPNTGGITVENEKKVRYLSMLAFAVNPKTGEDVEVDYLDAVKARINPGPGDKVVMRNGVCFLADTQEE